MLLSVTGAALLTVGAFNFVVDPLRVFGTPIRTGFNDQTPDTSGFDRMAKPYELLRVAPRTVLLGSSTARAGFRPIADWDTALPSPTYNYALLGANAHEIRLSLAQALRECPVEAVILAADFFAFNAHYPDNEQFDPARLPAATRHRWPGILASDAAAFLVGREALGLSWRTLVASRKGKVSTVPPRWEDHPWAVHFRNCERSYLAKWFPPPKHLYEFSSTQAGTDRLADFDACLHLCAERSVRLIVLCPPIHARLQEAISAAGAWPQYESWKRELARRTRAQQASSTRVGSVELWDFSLFNSQSCEPLPENGATPMRYFSDSAHFTPELGRLVLDEILNSGQSASTRLGVRLDQVEIESHLAGIRTALEGFRAANPRVIADVRAALGIEDARAVSPVASVSSHH